MKNEAIIVLCAVSCSDFIISFDYAGLLSTEFFPYKCHTAFLEIENWETTMDEAVRDYQSQ